VKKVVIVAPHFPPSNLTGVHRSRFFAMHLPKFGWEPIILTTKPEYYKEKLDWDMVRLVPAALRTISTKAFKPGFIGDIGIRAFFWHWRELRRLARAKEMDFILIPIPSNYSSLLGRLIYEEFKIPYGIDYIDPWIRLTEVKLKFFSKAWGSYRLARILEPLAVARASLITGVAESYYTDVLKRHKELEHVVTAAMPYGFEKNDHLSLDGLSDIHYLFEKKGDDFNFVYAGAMLPQGYKVLEAFFQGLKMMEDKNPVLFKRIKVFFIGTGKSPDDTAGFNVKPVAEKFNLYGRTVIEYPARMPYLHVLAHLNRADAVLIVGSTEKHYTASKTFQAVFSKRPILALLHGESTAAKFLNESNAGKTVTFLTASDLQGLVPEIVAKTEEIVQGVFDETKVNYSYFDQFTAEESARKLAGAMDRVV